MICFRDAEPSGRAVVDPAAAVPTRHVSKYKPIYLSEWNERECHLGVDYYTQPIQFCMWQRFTRSLKTAFKGRFAGGAATRQHPPGQFRTLISYSSSSATASSALTSYKQLGQSIFQSSSSSPFCLRSEKFHSPSNFVQLRLPRPPAIPRRVADVGLGTARKFSTARPLFQHLVQNVPVAGRAFYELDLDFQKKLNPTFGTNRFENTAREQDSLPKIPSPIFQRQPQSWISSDDSELKNMLVPTSEPSEEQLNNYFASPSPSFSIVTFLQIPLVPVPPLPAPVFFQSEENGMTNPADSLLTFLDLSSIASERVLYSTHAARVSSLYDKLNTNRVWEHGASCEALYDDSSGLCFALRVKFEGWTEEDTRSILDLTGDNFNWCTLWQEELPDSSDHQSFIMPILDPSSDPSRQEIGLEPSSPWDDLFSNEASQSEFDLLDLQSESEVWSVDSGVGGGLMEDTIWDLSNFSPGSVVPTT